jgi:hypothetical protein
VELGEVFALKSPILKKHHCQCISKGEHGGGAGGRGKVQGACLLIYRNVENDVRLASKVRPGIPRHNQTRDSLAFDERHNPKKFICVAAIAKYKN